jgi:hypothetical protein
MNLININIELQLLNFYSTPTQDKYITYYGNLK